jgi:hypothetical protein
MKKTLASLVLLAFVIGAQAQGQASENTMTTASAQQAKVPALDKSPMDMSYFHADFPILKTQNKVSSPPIARVVYSRPQ